MLASKFNWALMLKLSGIKSLMKNGMKVFYSLFLATTLTIFGGSVLMAKTNVNDRSIRVPAEWEPQDAVWLQWPGHLEKSYERAFAEFSNIIVQYEKLHILYRSKKIGTQARSALSEVGGNPNHKNIVWHMLPSDSAWMRDNGPVYLIENGSLRIQDWNFNAWGGAFGENTPFAQDDQIPKKVGRYLGIPVDQVDIVHERGNLEFNGAGTVILNWSTLGDPKRNPGYTRDQAKADLKNLFGVSEVIFIEGVPEGDLTGGHIDGIARFINKSTVVVAQCTDGSKCKVDDSATGAVLENAAQIIANAGLTVIREPIETFVKYKGQLFDTNYMNWIVGDGYVIATGFGDTTADANAKARLQSYFPGRDIYVIEMLESWAQGGGVHCHTNDQPSISQN